MSDDTKDPREGVLDAWGAQLEQYLAGYGPLPPGPVAALARLDAADPLRAMLPDAVKALEAARTEFFDVLASCDAERVHHDGDEFHERLGRIESALSKLRKLTPTEGRDGR